MDTGDTRPKPFVFVLMPFAAEFDDVYQLGIVPACRNAGAYAERVDKQIFQERILERIFNQIARADVIISDMSELNANVFYETGYAHALGKPVILLTRNAANIPFDLKDYPHIVYAGRIVDLIPKVERHVRWVLQHPKEQPRWTNLRYQIDGVIVGEGGVVECPVDGPKVSLRLDVDIHNSIEREAKCAEFHLGVITSRAMRSVNVRGVIPNGIHSATIIDRRFLPLRSLRQPDGVLLHRLDSPFSILPGDWASLEMRFVARSGRKLEPDSEHTIVMRAFFESGYSDLAFALRLPRRESGA